MIFAVHGDTVSSLFLSFLSYIQEREWTLIRVVAMRGMQGMRTEQHARDDLREWTFPEEDRALFTTAPWRGEYRWFPHPTSFASSSGGARKLAPRPPQPKGRVLINRDCSAIAGCRKRRVRIAPEAQAIFFRRRHQPRRPPLAKIRPERKFIPEGSVASLRLDDVAGK
jgi:hypothetical protein